MESKLANIIEAIIFVAEQPVSFEFIQEVLQDGPQAQIEIDFEKEEMTSTVTQVESEPISPDLIRKTLEELQQKYQADEYAFEIRLVGGGYQFYSKKEYFPYVRRATFIHHKKRLSRVAMETLAIVAYRQPITKAELEFIRGVNCDYAVQKLLDKKLVSIVGRSDAPGKPLLYATSPFFMQYFGLSDVSELPKLQEFEELAEEHLEAFRMNQIESKETEESNEEIKNEEKASILGAETGEEEAETDEKGTPDQREGEQQAEIKTQEPEKSDSPKT